MSSATGFIIGFAIIAICQISVTTSSISLIIAVLNLWDPWEIRDLTPTRLPFLSLANLLTLRCKAAVYKKWSLYSSQMSISRTERSESPLWGRGIGHFNDWMGFPQFLNLWNQVDWLDNDSRRVGSEPGIFSTTSFSFKWSGRCKISLRAKLNVMVFVPREGDEPTTNECHPHRW
jgi:hypothetical protein